MEVGRKNKYLAKKDVLFCVIPNYLLILRTSSCVNYGKSSIFIPSVECCCRRFLDDGYGCCYLPLYGYFHSAQERQTTGGRTS
jgi:hypothetical protein